MVSGRIGATVLPGRCAGQWASGAFCVGGGLGWEGVPAGARRLRDAAGRRRGGRHRAGAGSGAYLPIERQRGDSRQVRSGAGAAEMEEGWRVRGGVLGAVDGGTSCAFSRCGMSESGSGGFRPRANGVPSRVLASALARAGCARGPSGGSRGKTDGLHRTPAGLTTPTLDDCGLRGHWLARPAG